MIELLTCIRCGLETVDPLDRCPACGSVLVSPRGWARRGWVLVAIGILLAGGIAVVALLILQNLDNFNGGPGMFVFLWVVIGFVLCFGIVSLVGGIHMVRHQRRHRNLRSVMSWLVVALIAIGLVTRAIKMFGA